MIVTRAESTYIICDMLILLKNILTVLSTEEVAGLQESYTNKRGKVIIIVILRRVCITIIAVE